MQNGDGSSLESSQNMEIIKMKEESYKKMATELSCIQDKIKGLETKLGPSQSSTQSLNRTTQSRKGEQYEMFRSREENRMQKHEEEKVQQMKDRYQKLKESNKENIEVKVPPSQNQES